MPDKAFLLKAPEQQRGPNVIGKFNMFQQAVTVDAAAAIYLCSLVKFEKQSDFSRF